MVVSLTLLAGTSVPASAQGVLPQDPQDSVTMLTEGQEVMEGDWSNSKEINTVEESPVAKQMTQAEKNENAKVNDSWGGAITIIAMSIVVSALIILSILFFIFGKISSKLLSRKKRQSKGVAPGDTADDHHDDLESGELIAAIGLALAQHFAVEHDYEATILTLRRMKKAYSPWNSKIYNMRHTPDMPTHEGHIPHVRK